MKFSRSAVSNLYALNPLALAISASVLLAAQPALAEDDQVIELKTLSVTAEKNASDPSAPGEYTDEVSRSTTGLPTTAKGTPQTVHIISRQRIEDQNLSTLNDVLSQTAGVSVKEYDSARQYYYSRGFEINSILIDGVPTLFDPGWGTGENAANTHLYERVEVIKGANGLMTGSGNPSAAVNLVRKRAGSDELTGTAQVGIGSRNEFKASLDIADGLTESARGRAVVAHQQQDSFRVTGNSAQNLVYLTTEIDLADTTILTLGGSLQENINEAPTWGGIPGWYSDGTRTNYGRSKTTAADWAQWDTTHTNVFAEVEHALNSDWTLNGRYNMGINNGSSRLLYVYGNPDRDSGTGVAAYGGGKFSTDTEYDMLDVFVSGQYTLLDRSHPVSFGISRSSRDFSAESAYATSVAEIGDFNEFDGIGYPEHVWGEDFLYEEQTDVQTALYTSTRLHWSDRFATILGARLTNQKIDRAPAAFNDAQIIKHTDIFTPYIGATFELNNTLTAYASYTEMFFPQEERDLNGDSLDPIVGESLEAGLKAGFNDDRLIATAAVFQTLQDNLATADGTNSVAGTADQAYRETEGATSEGYELELTGAISDQWSVQLAWTDYEVRDADGEKVNTEQPRQMFKSFTRYQFAGDLSALTIGGGINWESESYANASNPATGNPEKVTQDAYALVSLMAKVQITPEFSTQLNVDNLTDETYYTNIGTFGQVAYGEPRTLSLTAKYNF